MELNSLLFPAPKTKYCPEDMEGDIIYIPRYFEYSGQYRKYMKKKNE